MNNESASPTHAFEQQRAVESYERSGTSRWIGWTALGFAVLQNICGALIAVSAFRTAIGLTSLLIAGGVWPAVLRFHADSIRVPMMLLALVGSLVNLVVVWQVYRLRARPAAAWRQVPGAPRLTRTDKAQLALSVVTLAALLLELTLHHALHHSY